MRFSISRPFSYLEESGPGAYGCTVGFIASSSINWWKTAHLLNHSPKIKEVSPVPYQFDWAGGGCGKM